MLDLKQTTFLIPVKIEHEDRANNLKIVVDYLSNALDTNIIIHEQDSDAVRDILKDYRFGYMKTEREDGMIHRTKQLNDMTKKATTPVVVNYDADVLCYPEIYKQAQEVILQNRADVVYPYNGKFYDVPRKYHDVIFERKTLGHIEPIQNNGDLLHPNSVGGAIFLNRQKYMDVGMENQNFMSWGFEDNERLFRFKKLGCRIARIGGALFHLTHTRTTNSVPEHPFYKHNEQEFYRIVRMHKQQLRQEVNRWGWRR